MNRRNSIKDLAESYLDILDRAWDAGESPRVIALLAEGFQLDLCRRELEIAQAWRILGVAYLPTEDPQ